MTLLVFHIWRNEASSWTAGKLNLWFDFEFSDAALGLPDGVLVKAEDFIRSLPKTTVGNLLVTKISNDFATLCDDKGNPCL